MISIRRQLIVGILGVFAALAGGGGALVYFTTRAALIAQIDARLRVEASAIIKQYREESNTDAEPSEINPKTPASIFPGSGAENIPVAKLPATGARWNPQRDGEDGLAGSYLPEFQGGGTEYFEICSLNFPPFSEARSKLLRSPSLGLGLFVAEPVSGDRIWVNRADMVADVKPRFSFGAIQSAFAAPARHGVNSLDSFRIPPNGPEWLLRAGGSNVMSRLWPVTPPDGTRMRAMSINFAVNHLRVPRHLEQCKLTVASDLGQLNQTLGALRAVLFGVGGSGVLAALVLVPALLRRGLGACRT